MKRTIAKALGVLGGAAAMLTVTATAASAGEITGNGKVLDVNGASICAYSGQNDEFHKDGSGGRVQSFGMYVRALGPQGGIPGTACNPQSGGH